MLSMHLALTFGYWNIVEIAQVGKDQVSILYCTETSQDFDISSQWIGRIGKAQIFMYREAWNGWLL